MSLLRILLAGALCLFAIDAEPYWQTREGVNQSVGSAPFDNGILGEWALGQGGTLDHVGGANDLYIFTEALGGSEQYLKNTNIAQPLAATLVWTFKARRKPGSPNGRDITFEQYNSATGGGGRVAGIVSLNDTGQAWLAQDSGFLVGTIVNTIIADSWNDISIDWSMPVPAGGQISFFMTLGFYSGDGASGIEFKDMKVEVQ